MRTQRGGNLIARWSRGVRLAVTLLAAGLGGCAALTNPAGEGVPVRRLPPELLAPSHEFDQTIPLQLLRQATPDTYRLAGGDVLAVYVEGFLGTNTLPPPTNIGPLIQARDQRRFLPSTGFPVPVQADGTIDLPGVGTVRVGGLSVPEAREAIRSAYVEKKLLRPDSPGLIVNLLQPRLYSVLVLRQESPLFTIGLAGDPIPTGKRGTGYEIELFAYENDVAHALARTGGLPGLDACDEVYVHHGCFRTEQERADLLRSLGGVRCDANPLQALGLSCPVVRIPLRTPKGVAPPIRPEDVILQNGDIVFIEARDKSVFYTGGLLPPGEHVLPRDHDLDALEAVAQVRGPLINGAFGGSNLSGTLLNTGVGFPSPTQLTVLRRTPGGGQVSIIVDLDVAFKDPRERLILRPGDMLILQEKPGQAFARYLTTTLLNFDLYWQVIRSRTATGVLDIAAPDRLNSRPATTTFNVIQ